MQKINILILTLLMNSLSGFSQHMVKGTLFDKEDKPLVSATIVLMNPADSTMKYFGISNKTGEFKVSGIRKGNYIMQISFVGTITQYKNMSFPRPDGYELGKIIMEPNNLGEVKVIGEYIPIRFKNDTTEFNAKAFSTRPGAVVEELLKKIPGIEVDLSGNIKAMGEDVVKVLVDGKEFFGNDTKIASKNLPADAVAKIQVFDKKSDQSEFSGIDDGVRERTINLELDEKVKIGAFGNVLVGGGHDLLIKEDGDEEQHYQMSGKVYRFTNQVQQALMLMSNNTNEFGFSTGASTKFGDGITGLNTNHAGALNLSLFTSKFNFYNLYYLGSIRNKIFEEVDISKNYINDAVYDAESVYSSETNSIPHNLNFKVRHRFKNNPNHYLVLSGGGSLSNGTSSSQDMVSNMIANQNISNLEAVQNAENSNLSGNLKGSYQAKFFEGKTQFSIPFDANVSDGFNGINFENKLSYFNPESLNVSSQFQNNQSDNMGASIHPRVMQQIGKGWHLSAVLNLGTKQASLNRELGYLLNDTKDPVASLSPEFNHFEKNMTPELSLQWTNSKHRLNFQIKGAWNQIDKTLWAKSLGTSTFFNPLGSISWEFEPRDNRRIKLNYMSYNTLPTLNQLMPISNTLNPLSVYIGNPDLEPSLTHRISSELSIFDEYSFTALFLKFSGIYTQNAFSTSRTISETLEQTLTPINVSEGSSINGNLDFSTPIKRFGLKIQLKASPNWSKSSNIINAQVNDVNSLTNTFRFSIENRFKERTDARLGATLSLTNTMYSIQEEYDNKYSTLSYYGDLRYHLNDHWHLWFRTSINTYNSESFDETFTFPLMHASVAYNFLEGGKASILLEGIDLLDRNNGFKQVSDINYMAQSTSNTIGRLVMLTFRYRFNQLGAGRR